MVDPRLEQYIKSKREAGTSDEIIRNELISNNWSYDIVNEALGYSSDGVPKPATHYYSIGELISHSFDLFKSRLGGAVLITLVPTVLMVLATFLIGVVSAIFLKQISALIGNANGLLPSLGLLLAFLLVILGVLVVQVWGGASLLYFIISKEKISFVESYKKSWKLVHSYMWINSLILLVTLGGWVLLIIPGIIFSVWLLFSQAVLIDENKKGMSAVLTSREYVRGFGWSIFGRLLLFIVVIGFIGGIFGLIIKEMGLEKNFFVMTTNALINSALGIFAVSMIVTMYKNIKSVKGTVDVTKKHKVGYVIVSIVGLIAMFAIPFFVMMNAINPSQQINKAREVIRRNNTQQIKSAITSYYEDNNRYPASIQALVPEYIKSIPQDPDDTICYMAVIKPDTDFLEVYSTEIKYNECEEIQVTEMD